MSETVIKSFFSRQRCPGDLVFALAFLLFSVFLLSQIGDQTKWIKGARLLSQPAFWPGVGVLGMTLFSLLHLTTSLASLRTQGRLEELTFWLRSLEYAGWFLLYVWAVPFLGYLPSSIIFMLLLTLRLGYREPRMLAWSVLIAVVIVIVFKGFLSVKIPGGALYEFMPDGIRNFFILNF
ncbi:MAG: tripartite tricarboxylate transporter TctB family protein [Pseudomonadota bacterium]